MSFVYKLQHHDIFYILTYHVDHEQPLAEEQFPKEISNTSYEQFYIGQVTVQLWSMSDKR